MISAHAKSEDVITFSLSLPIKPFSKSTSLFPQDIFFIQLISMMIMYEFLF